MPLLAAAPADVFFHVLLAMAAVIACGRLLGLACKRLGQPQVIGEVLAGIVLGPSVLGRLAPEAGAYLLPEAVAPYLKVIAELGVVLFMFLIGLELNTGMLRKQGRQVAAVSLGSIGVPLLLGVALAWFLYPRQAPAGASPTVFTLFLALALAVTAFPVLARILAETRLAATPLGAAAMAAAAINDALAWGLLALAVGVAQAKVGAATLSLLYGAGYVALMVLVVRPLMGRLVRRLEHAERLSPHVVAGVFLGLLLSALTTEAIGLHALFGAFLFGAVIPHESRLAREFLQKLEDLVGILFLPAFFAYTGMRTRLQLIDLGQLPLCLAIIAVATAGKFGGAALAARAAGWPWRQAAALGALMNTRGLMELIVLNVALDLNAITPALYAMLVVMALATTAMTGPLLAWIQPSQESAALGEANPGPYASL